MGASSQPLGDHNYGQVRWAQPDFKSPAHAPTLSSLGFSSSWSLVGASLGERLILKIGKVYIIMDVDQKRRVFEMI